MKGLIILVVVVLFGVAGWFFITNENLTRHPPEFDALRAAILKETHLEANIQVTQFNEHVDFSKPMNIVFAHVPARADKAEIDKQVRALVKQHLPAAREVDVQFGDNLNYGKKAPKQKISGTERAMERLMGEESGR